MTRYSLAAALAAMVAASYAAPAAARHQSGSGGITIHRGFQGRSGVDIRSEPRDRLRGRGLDNGWLLADRDYQGDSAWRPDGFNDWWHERPLRNEPRWVRLNGDCQRQYWSGGGWRC